MLASLTFAYWKFVGRISRNRRTVHSRGLRFSLQCNNQITHYRWEEYNSKEPETLDWIDRYIKDGDTFFDIGANIGAYSIYAAKRHPGAHVVAFEPEYANLHLLRDNVVENRLSERVSTYSVALSDRSGLSTLHIQDLTPGAAHSTESTKDLSMTISGKRVVAREGTYALCLDEFCQRSTLKPNYIKLDVDGTEPQILEGAAQTLAGVSLRSLILEMPDSGASRDLCRKSLSEAGLQLEWHDKTGKSQNEIWIRK